MPPTDPITHLAVQGAVAEAEARRARRRAAGLPEQIGAAEPTDLETNQEKYGYKGGKSPLQIAQERAATSAAKVEANRAAEAAPFTPEQKARDEATRLHLKELDRRGITDPFDRAFYLKTKGVDVGAGELATAYATSLGHGVMNVISLPFVGAEHAAKSLEAKAREALTEPQPDYENIGVAPEPAHTTMPVPPIGKAVELANQALALPFTAAQMGGEVVRERLGPSYFDPSTPGGRTRENVLQAAEMVLPIAFLRGAHKAPELARGIAKEVRQGPGPGYTADHPFDVIGLRRQRPEPAPEPAPPPPDLTTPEAQARMGRAFEAAEEQRVGEAARAIRPEDELRLASEPTVRQPGAEVEIAEEALRQARARAVEERLERAQESVPELPDHELRRLARPGTQEMAEAARAEVVRRAEDRLARAPEERPPVSPEGPEAILETRESPPPSPRVLPLEPSSPLGSPRQAAPASPAPLLPLPLDILRGKHRPSERGAALHGGPLGQLAVGGAEVAKKAARLPIDILRGVKESEFGQTFQISPKLKEFQIKLGYTVADALARARNAKVGSTRSAPEAARSVVANMPAEHKAPFKDYLKAKDGLQNAAEGKPIPNGKTAQQLEAEIVNAEMVIGREKLTEYEAKYREIADEAYAELLEAGKAPHYRENWVKNIAIDRAAERISEAGPKSTQTGVGSFMPGSARTRHGTTAAIEDPIRALALAKQESQAARTDYLFQQEVVNSFSRNAELRADPAAPNLAALGEDFALYAFDTRPGEPALLVGDAARRAIELVMGREGEAMRTRQGKGGKFWQEPVSPNDPFVYGPPGQEKAYYALPRKLAEGLHEEGQLKAPGFAKWMAKGNSAIMHSILNFPILNLGYHAGQIFSDVRSGLQNVPYGHKLYFLKQSAKHFGKLLGEFYKIYAKGERSPLVRSLEEKNLFGTNFESMFEEIRQLGDVEHIVTERAEPLRDRSTGANLKAVVFSVSNLGDLVGKARESGVMQGMVDAVRRAVPEMSEESAIALARRRAGGYDQRSAAGTYLAPWTQFTRWYTNTVAELTVRLARDPLTKKRNLRGLWLSPAPSLAVAYAVMHAVNHRDPETAKIADEALPRANSLGFVTPWRTEDGKPVILQIDSYLDVAVAIADAAKETAFGSPVEALQRLGKWGAGRVTPMARTPVELLTNKSFKGGRQPTPERYRRLPTDKQAEINAAEGGLPVNFATQYAVEQFSHLPHMWKKLTAPGLSPWERAQALGSPFRVVDPRQKLYEEGATGADDAFKAIVAEVLKPPTGRNFDLIKEKAQWLQQRGYERTTINAEVSKAVKAYKEATKLTPEQKRARKYEGIRNPLQHPRLEDSAMRLNVGR